MARVLYFAYGALLDQRKLRRRCLDAVSLGRARLPDFRLAFTRYSRADKGGVADVVPEPGAEVWGALYDIDDACLASLDEYEEAPRAYRRETARVIAEDGVEREAVIYIANKTGDFAPSRQYLAIIVGGAREHGLPEEYVQGIEQVRPHS
ncbi:MAG: gamma-glutamylcyclotransferase family protein [Dehalococcoidia bacterium]